MIMIRNFYISCRSFTLLLTILSAALQTVDANFYVKFGPGRCSISYDGKAADCSHRSLSKPPLNLPKTVEYLDLSTNQLDGDSLHHLGYLEKLRFLKLNSNRIKYIDSSRVPRLPFLEILLLKWNPLSTVEESILKKFPSLKYLNLDHTRLICDNKITWLVGWLSKAKRSRFVSSSEKQMKCYDRSAKQFVILASLERSRRKGFTSREIPKKRLRRSRVSFNVVYWTCSHLDRIILLYNSTFMTSSSTLCYDHCSYNGFQYMLLDESTCTCGELRPSKAGAIVGCSFDCRISKPRGCDLQKRDYASLTEVVLTSVVNLSVDVISKSIGGFATTSDQMLSSPSLSDSSQLSKVTEDVSSSVSSNASTSGFTYNSAWLSFPAHSPQDTASSDKVSVDATKSASTSVIPSTTVSTNTSGSYSQIMTPSLHNISLGGETFFASPKTSFIPTTSRTTSYIALTQTPSENPEVISLGHRSVREISSQSSLSSSDSSSKSEVTIAHEAFTFTNASTKDLTSLAINVSFRYNASDLVLRYIVGNNNLSHENSGVYILNSNSIAVPENTVINISVSITVGKGDDMINVQSIHKDTVSNLSLLVSGIVITQYITSQAINSSLSGPFSFQLRFTDDDDDDSLATVTLNFTSIEPMGVTPEPLMLSNQYVPTFENLYFAFGSNYSFVEATWTLFDSTKSSVLYRNTSGCTSNCLNETSSQHTNCTYYSCILSMTYFLRNRGDYYFEVEFTNPITRVALRKRHWFIAETKITKLSISSCDYHANVDEPKEFWLTYIGDIISVTWFSSTLIIANDTFRLNYTANALGNYTLSAFASNHLSNASHTVNIGVYQTGSIHGLNITRPSSGSYHPTSKSVYFSSQLCEGENPQLNWNFGDGVNLTTNVTNCSHTFFRPMQYVVTLKAGNSQTKTETQSITIYLQDEIRNFTVFISKTIVRVNEPLHITAQVDRGTDVQYEVSSEHLPTFAFNTNASNSFQISVAGNSTLSVKAYNQVSAETASLHAIVQELIDLVLDGIMYKTMKKLEEVTAKRQSGTHMYTKWDFGDGNETNWLYIGSAIPRENHTYETEGNYTLRLSARNDVNQIVNYSSQVYVEKPLSTNINITSPRYVATNSSFNVSISIHDTSIYGYNVSLGSDFLLLAGRYHQTRKKFTKAGTFDLNLHVWNHVSSAFRKGIVTVQDKIVGSVEIYPKFVAQSSTNSSRLTASVQGSDPRYNWTFQNYSSIFGNYTDLVFPQLGIVYFDVTATNEISSVTSRLNVSVQIFIDNLTLSTNASYSALNTPVAVVSSLSMRQEHVYSWQVDGVALNQRGDNIVYTFSTLGMHWVSLSMSNDISSQSAAVDISVQEPIRGVSIVLQGNVSVIPFNESVTINARFSSGSNMTFTWCTHLTCITFSNPEYNVSVSRLGNFYLNLTVIAKNNISEGEDTKLIPVVQRIKGVRIITAAHHIILNTSATFTFELNYGSNFSIEWSVNEILTNSIGRTFIHTFPQIGDFKISVVLRNQISSSKTTVDVKVQSLFEIIDLFPKSATTNETTVFSTVDLSKNGVHFEWTTPNVVGGSVVTGLNVSLKFSRAGIYPLFLKASNLVQQVNKTFYIAVQDPIMGLGVLNDKVFYTSMTNASYSASVTSGSNVTFSWYIAPQSGIMIWGSETKPTIDCFLATHGQYLITVNAANLVSSKNRSFSIYVQDAPQILNLTSTFGTVLPTNENITLEAVVSGTNVSVSFSSQENVRLIEQFGRNITCIARKLGEVSVNITAYNMISAVSKVFTFVAQERLIGVLIWSSATLIPVGGAIDFQAITRNGTDLSFAWLVNGTILRNRTGKKTSIEFSRAGVYEIKVEVKNDIINSLRFNVVEVSVELPGCPPPVVAISGGAHRTLLRSQWLYFESSIEYNCSTSSVSSSWSLRIAKDTTDCLLERASLKPYYLDQAVDLNSTLLAMQPGALHVGTYCLYYTAAYGHKGKFNIYSAAILKVIPSPPIPVILGGKIRLIGQNQTFSLDASESIDPDNVQPTELLFQWNCTLDSRNTTITKSNLTGCRNTTWKVWNDGKLLLVPAGSLAFSNSYDFILSVKKFGGSPVYASQRIVMVATNTPDVYLQCLTCNVYKTFKYIVNRSLKLRGTCKNCHSGFGSIVRLKINWIVTASNGSIALNISRSTTEQTDLLIINPNTLNGIDPFTIKFSLIVSGNTVSSGYSQILLKPNKAPENGTCGVAPVIGVTLKTRFTVNCNGWQDSDNIDTPLIFLLKVQSATGSWAIVYRGIRSVISVYLPVGNSNTDRKLSLQVLIEDTYGAQAIGLERAVQVYPPDEDPTTFLETNVMSGIKLLTSENDLNKVVSITQASTKLLSESGTLGAKQTGILSTLTESTSQMNPASLEAVDQLSVAIQASVSLVNEAELRSDARVSLTTSLDRMITKVDAFASQGQLANQATLESLLFLVQNNIASEASQQMISRKRRSVSQSSAQVKRNLNLAMQLYTAILRASIRGEDASVLSNKYGQVVLRREKSQLLNTTLSSDDCSFVLNKVLGAYSDVFQIFNVSYNDPFTKPSPIESKIAGLSYSMPNGTEIAVKDLPDSEAILIRLDGSTSRKRLLSKAEYKVVPAKGSVEGEILVIGIDVNATTLIFEIMSHGRSISNIDAFVSSIKVANGAPSMFRFNVSKQGTLIKHFHAGEFNISERHALKLQNQDKNLDANLSVFVYSSSCVFWDRNEQRWKSDGVTPVDETNLDYTVCRSTHLTSFASTFKIAPNPIRWSTLSELDIEKNPIALALCLALIVIYLLGIFFAGRKDGHDRQESHYIPMMGNEEFFKYEVRLKTGSFPGAGTSAAVGIQIYATKCVTKPIVLAKQKSFQRNSVDIFRFASSTRLGKISRIRVWHDNSGSSPSWYLSRIVIKNLLNGQKYFFFCNRWLGVDRDDGEVERFFQVADAKMMAKFQTIFNDTIGRTFSDYHLWMSIFEKPKLSRFTRVQRLTCCVTFLLSWMCVDAMWYGTVRERTDLYIGLKGYSYEEVIVGIISSLMVFPVNFLIVLIFRNCRLPKSSQIIDGDDEIAIHVLSKSHRTRRLSEDWIEIEDITESHSLIDTSLPRCGGYFRLTSFNQFSSLQEQSSRMVVESLSNPYCRDAMQLENPEDSFSSACKIYRAALACTLKPSRPAFLQSGPQYSKIPASYEIDSSVDADAGKYDTTQVSSRCSTTCEVATVSTQITALSSRNGQGSTSFPPETGRRHSSNNNEYMSKSAAKYQNLSDSFSSRHSSRITSSSTERTFFNDAQFQVNADSVDEDALTRNVPDIRELHSSLDCMLPSWFIVVAYFICLGISVLAFLVILIYGQQFGKDKALSWLQSIFSGLLQDVFVTYPVLLVIVALFWAILRKPMNLDYSDFVTCPVIPGDPNASSEPVRGYALEIAQRQGRGKREIRRIMKNLIFQIVHLWLVLSICITSYEQNTYIVQKEYEMKLFPGNGGIQSVNSIAKIWTWMETDLPKFIYPAVINNENWVLRSEPRLRQIRIRSEDCPVPKAAETVKKSKICNPDFFGAELEKREFVRNWIKPEPSKNTPWSFKTEDGLNATMFIGSLGNYPRSGYLTVLGLTESQYLAHIANLKAAGWLDLRTRALFIEFVMQNININKYTVNTVAFEFSSTGLVLQHFEVMYLRVHMYVSRLDHFRLFCEVIFGLLTFYQLWLIQDKLRRRGRRFFDKFWNVHLLFSFAVNACAIGLSIYRLFVFLKLRPYLKKGVPQGYDLRKEATIDWSIRVCFGFVCFLLIVKIISLLTWTRAYRIVGFTLRRKIKHLFLVTIGFLLVLNAFASWGYLAFGPSCFYFHTYWRAIVYTIQIRNWDTTDSSIPQNGMFILWNVLYVFFLLAFVVSFFRAALCASYKDGKFLYLTGNKMHQVEITKYLYNRFTLRKKKPAKRVKFSLNPSVRRNTLAMSQQTISLGSDQWLSSHSLASYSHIPSYFRQQAMNRLTPITDEILHHVHQLEYDEIMEDEFYSRLERIADVTRSKSIRPRHVLEYR